MLKRLMLPLFLLLLFASLPAHASVSRTDTVVTYAGNGVAVSFAVPFRVLAEPDLVVTDTEDATGIETTLTLNVDYYVTGEGRAEGEASVTLDTPPETGHTLTITRATERIQPMVLQSGSPLYPKTLETAHDRAVLIAQEADHALADHGAADDPHPGYVLEGSLAGAETDPVATAALATHQAAPEPHPAYVLKADLPVSETDPVATADLASHAADPTHVAPSCAAGQTAIWDGSAWGCGDASGLPVCADGFGVVYQAGTGWGCGPMLAGLSCVDGESPLWDDLAGAWTCARPATVEATNAYTTTLDLSSEMGPDGNYISSGFLQHTDADYTNPGAVNYLSLNARLDFDGTNYIWTRTGTPPFQPVTYLQTESGRHVFRSGGTMPAVEGVTFTGGQWNTLLDLGTTWADFTVPIRVDTLRALTAGQPINLPEEGIRAPYTGGAYNGALVIADSMRVEGSAGFNWFAMFYNGSYATQASLPACGIPGFTNTNDGRLHACSGGSWHDLGATSGYMVNYTRASLATVGLGAWETPGSYTLVWDAASKAGTAGSVDPAWTADATWPSVLSGGSATGVRRVDVTITMDADLVTSPDTSYTGSLADESQNLKALFMLTCDDGATAFCRLTSGASELMDDACTMAATIAGDAGCQVIVQDMLGSNSSVWAPLTGSITVTDY